MEIQLAELGVLPVVSPLSLEAAVPLAKALCNGGLPVLEITLRTPWAIESIRQIANAIPTMMIGAGTVLRKEQVDQALDAGARFVVTPGLDAEIVRYCQQRGLPVVPGCCTPTEITQALSLGLTTLKFFPAETSGGTAALKLLHGPFAECRFIPTGGLTMENIGNYLALPYVLACGGSFIAPKADMAAERWDAISENCRRCLEIAATARKKSC